jgi:phosphohistidine phosphatase
MKTLYLLRHCKAWSTPPNAGDHDCPLLESGIADATAIGQYLEKSGAKIGQALCSTAVRAEETFEALAKQLSGAISVRPERALYTTTAGGILASIKETDTEIAQLLMIGHVPAIQELAIALCGGGSPQLVAALTKGFSSGTLATLTFDIPDWTGVALRAGDLTDFISPEQLPAN